MVELYPVGELLDQGMLDVGDSNSIYYEVRGHPQGKPAVVVHGGPGQGFSPAMSRCMDPEKYRIVLFDQRGCGRSVPHASELSTPMDGNTTWHLVSDMEKLREHLGIERWLLSGGSWGSTLSLVYAEQYPERVSGIVLVAVTTGQRLEHEWLYRGASLFFPEEFERFRNGVPVGERDGNLVHAYARLMENADIEVRSQAARDWCVWEDAVLSLEPNAKKNAYSDQPDRELLAFVRICAHYVAHGAWLEDGAVLKNAGRLAGIPGVLIHGKLDLSCPLSVAWDLERVWSDARLVVLDDCGHLGSPSKREALIRALDGFAKDTP